MISVKISQNFIKSHLKICLISQTSVHSLWHVCTWPLSKCTQNLKTVLIEAGKSENENSIGGKEKWTNKGKDKQQGADSLLHNTTSHTKHFVPNFKILGVVVPDKSLTKKKVYT